MLHDIDFDSAQARRILSEESAISESEEVQVAGVLVIGFGRLASLDVTDAEVLSTDEVLAKLYGEMSADLELDVELDSRLADKTSVIVSARILLGMNVEAVFDRTDMALLEIGFPEVEVVGIERPGTE